MLLQKSSLLASCALIILSAASALAQSTILSGPNVISIAPTYKFPVVGLAGTETMQVNIANLATVPSSSTTTASCTGSVSFSNASGAAIRTPVKFTVGSGDIFSVPLPFANTGYSSRGEILASVQQTLAIPPASLCSLAISLEIFDTGTGVSHVVLTAPAAAATPLVGVLSAQPPGR